MKKLLLFYILTCSFFNAFSQLDYDVIAEQRIRNDTVLFDLYIKNNKPVTDSFKLGTSNFVVNVDTNKVKPDPVLVEEGIFSSEGPATHNSFYQSMTLDSILSGSANSFNLSVRQSTTDSLNAPLVSGSKDFIGTVGMEIKTCGVSHQATWRMVLPFGDILDYGGNSIRDSANFVNSSTITLTFDKDPAASFTKQPSGPYCKGDSVTLHAQSGFTNYVFKSKGAFTGDLTQGRYIDDSTYRINTTDLNSGDSLFAVFETSGSNCKDTTQKKAITIYKDPSIISGPTSVCSGKLRTYESDVNGNWSVKTNISSTVLTPVLSIDSVDVQFGLTSSKVKDTLIVNNNGCRDSLRIKVLPPPDDTLRVTNSNFCEGDSALYHVTPENDSVTWKNGSGMVVKAKSTDTTFAAKSSGSFYAVLENGSCIDSTDTKSVTKIPPPDTTINVSPSSEVCEGDTITLTTEAGLDSARWYNSSDMLQSSDTSLKLTSTGTHEIYLVAYKDGCNDTSTIHSYKITSAPSAEAGPDTSVCKGSTYEVEGASVSDNNSFSWDHDGNGNLNDTNTLSPEYDPDPVNDKGNTVILTLTATGNGSCADVKDSADVFIKPGPEAIVSGDATICKGDTGTIGVELTGAMPYNLIYSSSTAEDTANDINSNFYEIKEAPDDTTKYWIDSVWTSGGCTGDTIAGAGSASINVKPLPDTTVTASPGFKLCSTAGNDTITLYAPSGIDQADWYDGANDTLIATADSLKTELENATDSISVYMVSKLDGCTDTSSTYKLEILPSPDTAINVSKSAFCPGDSSKIWVNGPVESVTWKDGMGTTLKGPSADTTYFAKSGGDYYALLETGSCLDTSDTASVMQKTNPETSINNDGDTVFCAGGSVTLFVPGNANQYTWKDSTGKVLKSGSDSSYVADSTHKYYAVVDSGGCTDSTRMIMVEEKSGKNTISADAGADTTICKGSSVMLSGEVSNGPANTVEWKNESGSVIANNKTVSVSPADTSEYFFKATGKCTSDTDSMVVNVDPGPPASSISGLDSACENQKGITYQVITSSSTVAKNEFRWKVPSAATIVSDTSGTGNNKITVDFSGFTSSGDISVYQISPNGCIGDTVSKTIYPKNNCNLIADFSIDKFTNCEDTKVIYTDNSKGNITSYFWEFGPDANPGSATGKGPHDVVYSSTGEFDVTLSVFGPLGSDSKTKSPSVKVINSPGKAPDATDGASFCDSVRFNWKKIKDVSKYQVKTREGIKGNFSSWINVGDTNTYTYSPVSYPDTVYLKVRGFNTCDTTDASDIVKNRPTFCAPDTCNVPSVSFTGDSAGCTGEIRTLEAHISSSLGSYKVSWQSNPPDTLLTYDYTIKNEGKNIVDFVIGDTARPECYDDYKINVEGKEKLKTEPHVGVDTVSCHSITFKWKRVEGAKGYSVSEDSGNTWKKPSSGSNGQFHQITGLSPGESRSLLVRANGACNKTFSDTSGSPKTCDCYVGHISKGDVENACKNIPVELFISDINAENWTINWIDPVKGPTGPQNDSTYTFNPDGANTTYYVKYELKDISLPDSCVVKDSIKVKTGSEGDPTWSLDPDTFCVKDVPYALTNHKTKGIYQGNGVRKIGDTWYFDPELAGPGMHTITHNVCGATESENVKVIKAPCVFSLSDPSRTSGPQGVYTACNGTVYFTDDGKNAIFKVDTLGNTQYIAGDTTATGDIDRDGYVGYASTPNPKGIVYDETTGHIYFSVKDSKNKINRIKKYNPFTQQVTSVAGSISGDCPGADCGENQPKADDAQFKQLWDITLSANGDTIYFADRGNNKIRSLNFRPSPPQRKVKTVSSNFNELKYLDANQNSIFVTENPSPNLFIKEYNINTGNLKTIMDINNINSSIIDGDTNTASIGTPAGVAVDAVRDQFYYTDEGFNVVRLIDSNRYTKTIAGHPDVVFNSGTPKKPDKDNETGPLNQYLFDSPTDISFGSKGILDVVDKDNNRIKRVLLDLKKFGLKKRTYCADEPADTLKNPYRKGFWFVIKGDPGLITDDTVFHPSADTGKVILGYQYQFKQCDQHIKFRLEINPNRIKTILPDSTSACKDTISLVATDSVRNNYQWYKDSKKVDKATSRKFRIDSTGQYSVQVRHNACTAYDTTFVENANKLDVKIQKPAKPLCSGDTFMLHTGKSYPQYLWSDSTTSDSMPAYMGGVYYVNVKDTLSGCRGGDTIPVRFRGKPSVSIRTSEKQSMKREVSVFAGNGSPGFTNANDPLNASFHLPYALAKDSKGNIYVAEKSNNAVRKISPSGKVSTFASNLYGPRGLAVDRFDNIYVSEIDSSVIRKITPSGDISLYAGIKGKSSPFKDSTRYNSTFFHNLNMDIDGSGRLYVADAKNNVIRIVEPTGKVSTIGKESNSGYTNGDYEDARFNHPHSVTISKKGNIYTASNEAGTKSRVRKINPFDSTVSTYNKKGNKYNYINIFGLDTDPQGNVYLSDKNNTISKIDFTDSTAELYAGEPGLTGFNKDTVNYDTARFNGQKGILRTDNNGLLVADYNNNVIRKIDQYKYINLCPGDTDTLYADAGFNNYRWHTSSGTVSSGPADSVLEVDKEGTYYITVRTADGCTATDSVKVNVSPSIKADAGANDTLCTSDTVMLGGTPVASGGSGFYDYQWNSNKTADFVPSDSIAKPKVWADDSVEYRVTVTDSLGCKDRDTTKILVDTLRVEAGGINDSIGLCKDSVKLGGNPAAEGGSGNYIYQWTPSSGLDDDSVPNPDASVSSAVTYNLKVMDKRDTVQCKVNDSVTVFIPPAINLNPVSNRDTVCEGDTTQLHANASGGTGKGFSYAWSPDSVLNDTTVPEPVASIDEPQQFQLVITDSGSLCKRDTSLKVFMDSIPRIKVTSAKDTSCPGPDIMLDVNVTAGGNGDYGYNWFPAGSINDSTLKSPVATPKKTTTYQTVVLDSVTGCKSDTGSTKIYIKEFEAEATANGSADSIHLCNGDTVNLNAELVKGNETLPLNYQWHPSAGLEDTIKDPVVTPSDTTLYKVRLKDADSCSAFDSVKINVTPLPVANAASFDDTLICEGQNVKLGGKPVVDSGVPPYTYSWKPSSGLTDPSAKAPEASPSDSTVYRLIVNDDLNCKSSPDSVLINVRPMPSAQFNKSNEPGCLGDSVTLSVDDSLQNNVLFTWNELNPYQFLGKGKKFNVGDSGIYQLIAKDTLVNNCADTSQQKVDFIAPPRGLTIANDPTSCKNDSIRLQGGINTGDSLLINWRTNGTGKFESPMELETMYYPGLNEADSAQFYLETGNACDTIQDTTSVNFLVTPEAKIIASKDEAFKKDKIQFFNKSIKADKYFWRFGDGNSSNKIEPTHSYDNAANYVVKMKATNTTSGCSDMDSVTIDIGSHQMVFVPNVFKPDAPNPDNAHLKVFGTNISNTGFKFTVYNRWGEIVFQTDNFNYANQTGWNGVNQSSGKPSKMGTYTYVVKGKFIDGTSFRKTGTATLVR